MENRRGPRRDPCGSMYLEVIEVGEVQEDIGDLRGEVRKHRIGKDCS